ncbi:MAG TPA: chemotaxis protein [Gallionella sp.]|nr:chemotaxis protein [Gallionella sp.]
MIYLKTILVVLAMLTGWLLVRAIARRYAEQHPEFGALREEGEGCGCGNKRCKETQCKRQAH